MTTLEAIALGVLQGVAEFLPISSSAHLQLLSHLFSIQDAGPSFFILLHVATACAILTHLYSFRPISFNWKYLQLLFVASLPLVFVALKKVFFLGTFSSAYFPAVGFIVTAFFLIASDFLPSPTQSLKFRTAFLMGCLQIPAVIPGISRSGMTIFGGIASKTTEKETVIFSLLMGTIASFGALLLEVFDTSNLFTLNFQTLLAFASAYLVALFSIRLLLWLVQKRQLKWVGFYLFLLSAWLLLDKQ